MPKAFNALESKLNLQRIIIKQSEDLVIMFGTMESLDKIFSTTDSVLDKTTHIEKLFTNKFSVVVYSYSGMHNIF